MMIPILVTVVGIVTDVKAVLKKADPPNDNGNYSSIMMMMIMMIPIVVTPVGIVTAVRLVQYWKVLPPNNYDIVMVVGVTYFL